MSRNGTLYLSNSLNTIGIYDDACSSTYATKQSVRWRLKGQWQHLQERCRVEEVRKSKNFKDLEKCSRTCWYDDKRIERKRLIRKDEDKLKLKVTLGESVLDGEIIVSVIGQILVECKLRPQNAGGLHLIWVGLSSVWVVQITYVMWYNKLSHALA